VSKLDDKALSRIRGENLLSGEPQAALLHTNVGLANGVIGLLNAAFDRVPLLLMSGRTPWRETGHAGARAIPIGWGQEMRDQAAMVREATKWDHQLVVPEQAAVLVDRALAIARSTPAGPVYLALPREPLGEPIPLEALDPPLRLVPVQTAAAPSALEEAARWIRDARRIFVVAQRGPRDPTVFERFAYWAVRRGVAVSSYWTTRCVVPTDHPAHVGGDPAPWLAHADLVLVLDSPAPWPTAEHGLAPHARVIQLGPDPLFRTIPTRGFAVDLGLAGELDATLAALLDRLEANDGTPDPVWSHRIEEAHGRLRAALTVVRSPGARISRPQVGAILGELLDGRPSTLFSELGVPFATARRRDPLSWFQEPHAGGLGWGVPAAMGARLAAPEREVVAVVGDGSWIFANPAAVLQVLAREGIAMLVVVLDNRAWGTVQRIVRQAYPDGYAARANRMPMTELGPAVDFAAEARAFGIHGARVSRGERLRATLARALEAVRAGEPALVQVAIAD